MWLFVLFCFFFPTITISGHICIQQNSCILRWPWMRALVKRKGLEYGCKRSDMISVFRLQVGAFHFWRKASYEQRFRFKRDKLNCNIFTMFADSKCSLAAKNLCIKPMVTWVESLIYFFWSGCNQNAINQLINQSINQSISQSVSQSTNQSINQSINQSVSQSINEPINESINQSVNQSINQ